MQAVGASWWWGRNVNWERQCGRVMGPVLSGTGGTRRLRTVPQITPSSRLAMMPPPASQASLDPRPIPAHVAGKTVRRCPPASSPPLLTSNSTEHYALHLMSISSKVRKNRPCCHTRSSRVDTPPQDTRAFRRVLNVRKLQ